MFSPTLFTPTSITALIIASSFAGGLNIYATVLTLGLLARTHVVLLPPGLDPLGHTWVLVTCAVLFAIEFFADKIPGFDLFWNLLHTLVRVPIAALVAYHASCHSGHTATHCRNRSPCPAQGDPTPAATHLPPRPEPRPR